MAETMMRLGKFRFGMEQRAYSEASRQWSFEHVEKARLGTHAALQFVSIPAEVITLSGVVYPGANGINQISEMAEAAKAGQPMLMVDGTGRNWGRVVITSISETLTHFWPTGRPRRIEFNLELKSHG